MGMSGAGWVPGPVLLKAFACMDACVSRWKAGEYVPLAYEIDGVKDIALSGYGFFLECLVKTTTRTDHSRLQMRAQNMERLQQGALKVFHVPIWAGGQCASLGSRLWKAIG